MSDQARWSSLLFKLESIDLLLKAVVEWLRQTGVPINNGIMHIIITVLMQTSMTNSTPATKR